MGRRWAWVWGLAVVPVLAVVAAQERAPSIEGDLVERARAALVEAGQGWGVLAGRGREITLGGDAPTEERRRLAIAALQRIDGVKEVRSTAGVLPSQSPYTISLERRGDQVTLSGFAPDADVARRLSATLRTAIPAGIVSGTPRLAGGLREEPVWLAGFDYAAGLLSRMSEGRATLSDLALTVEGRARDLDALANLASALRDPPRGITIARSAISPPVVQPFTWSAVQGADGVTLTGHVPSDDVRASLRERAERLGPVRDEMRPGDGAPPAFAVLTALALEQLGRLVEGRAQLTDTTLALEGTARSPQAYADLLAAVDRAPSGVRITTASVRPATVAPYTWTVTFDGTVVVFAGHVPDTETRGRLLEQATRVLPGRPVVDRLLIAAGAPASFGAVAAFAVGQLSHMARGEIRASDTVLTVDAVAANPASFAPLFSPAQVPNGAVVAAQITPATVSPHVVTMARTARGLVLSGVVPGPAARAAVTDALRTAAPNAALDDQAATAVGSPLGERWDEAARFAAAVLARLGEGRVVLQDATLTVAGQALSVDDREAILDALQRLPAGLTGGAHAITAPPPPVRRPPDRTDDPCQTIIDGAVDARAFAFEAGSATLPAGAGEALDALANALSLCPDARVEIGGHTDASGERGQLIALSRRRADAVAAALVDRGIAAERLSAVGYGPDAPLRPNDTEEGRARNRRIDVLVRP